MFFEVNNLCFSYYRKPLCLKDISFSAERGDKILVLASEGMGKSTLLSVLCGFENSYFGSIKLDGIEIKQISDENKNFSYLPENPVLLKNKNIKENIEFLFKNLNNVKIDDELAEKVCMDFGLYYNSKIKLKKLSKLNQKKFTLARAFIKNSDIIFLDDQFYGLTEDENEDMLMCYKNTLNSNKTVILTLGDKTYKNFKKYIKSFNFNNILYLCDTKLRFFKNFDEFENDYLTLDMLLFSDEKFEKTKCVIEKQEGFYNIYFGEKFFSLNQKFNKQLDKLELKIEDDEYAILCTKVKFILSDYDENKFNKLLERGEALIFSNISGERLI